MEYAATSGVSLFEALETPEMISSLGNAAMKRLAGFRSILEKLVRIGAEAPDAATAVERMLSETGLVANYEEEGSTESVTRAENLRELLGAAQEFDLQRAQLPPLGEESLAIDAPPLQTLLEQISLMGDADEEVPEGRVSLMTLHAAKGLEFDVVFLTGMEDGVFPHSRALDMRASEEDMAEERRLCYVGFTRARRRLYVSFAQSRSLFGEVKYNPPSRFLAEVPRELFGFDSIEMPERAPAAATPPRIRRASEYESTGPYVDRSYAQNTELSGAVDDVKGMRVTHPQFGSGTVLDVDGMGPNAKLTVKFPTVGLKRVIARFLTPG
jgi:DNA helicase-2/ATP-dependent DNA helicase PcrA